MRRYLVAGNWKLNMEPRAGHDLATAGSENLRGRTLRGGVLVCPPLVTIPPVAEVDRRGPVLLCDQNVPAGGAGAYTGEVSAALC